MKHYAVILLLSGVLVLLGVSPAQAQNFTPPYTIGLDIIVGTEAFIDEMAGLGYIEGENITYLYPMLENVALEESLAARTAAVEAIINNPDLDIFVANTDTDALGFREQLRADVPIVFARSDDPVATGAVADLVAPGGSITGVVTNRPHERRLQLLTEIIPTTDKVVYLYSPLTGDAEVVREQTQVVADELGVELIPVQVIDGATAAEAMNDLPEGIDWFFMTPFLPFYDMNFFMLLFEKSTAFNAPIAYISDDANFYLMGYGPNYDETGRQAARLVDRILRGADPAQLPIETADNYLMVNLETAQMFGIEIPVGVLRQARLIVRPGDLPTLEAPPPSGS
jgi:putative ABC transport system substrate-binding protein